MTRLLVAIVLKSCVVGSFDASERFTSGEAQVDLSCSTAERTAGATIEMTCVIRNRSSEPILVLASDATLEGPVGTRDYVYKYAGGWRYENVLRYGIKSNEGLDRPTLFDPSVDLTDADLGRLLRVSEGGMATIQVEADLGGASELVQNAELLVRLKVIFVSAGRLRAVLGRPDLPEACRGLITTALRESPASSSVKIATQPFKAGKRNIADGCHNRISEQFQHAYSEVLEARAKPAQK